MRVPLRAMRASLLAIIGAAVWTAPVGAQGSTPPPIVINELHYHPADSAVAPGVDPEALQFLELVNADTMTVSLAGWTISDGVVFQFPPTCSLEPGEYLVVVKNAVELQLAGVTLPAGVQFYEWLSGNLANDGERVALSDDLAGLVDEVTYSDAGSWPLAADGDGPSLELVNPLLPNEYGQAWKASTVTNGTPGDSNSVAGPPAPLILDTVHQPPIPGGGQSVTIVANVVGITPPAVTVFYRQDFNPTIAYSSTDMAAAPGVGPDAYSVTLPGLSNGERYDFYIQAVDADTNTTIVPPGHEVPDLIGNPSQTLLCKFSSAAIPGDFPTYHIIITEANRSLQEDNPPDKTEYDATFIDSAGNIFYNVRERYRGSSSISQDPKSYRVDFNPGRPLASELGFSLTALNLMAQNPQRQAIGYDFFAAAGGWTLPSPLHQFVRLKVNPTDNAGNLLNHVYINVERVDDEFLESQGGVIVPPRFPVDTTGSLYRGRNTATLDYLGDDPDLYRTNELGRDGYEKITNEDEDQWDDLITLCRALDVDETPDSLFQSTVEALADVDEWCRWFAIHMVLANREGGLYRDTGDDYFIYFHPIDAPNGYSATLINWDMDSVLGGFNPDQFVVDETIWRTGDVSGTPAAPRRFLRSNAFAPIFVKAIRDLLDLQFTSACMDSVIDALPDAVADAAWRQGAKDYVVARRDFILNEIVSELTLDTSNLPEPYTDTNPAITLEGTLNQAGTHGILVNGLPATFSVYHASWSFDDTLHPYTNSYVIQAIGRQGEVVGEIQHVITYLPPNVGTFEAADDPGALAPRVTRLLGAFPNPFGAATTIRYELAQSGPVRVRIYDVHGRLVKRVLEEPQPIGRYAISWAGAREDGRDVADGVYLYELEAPGFAATRKLLIVR